MKNIQHITTAAAIAALAALPAGVSADPLGVGVGAGAGIGAGRPNLPITVGQPITLPAPQTGVPGTVPGTAARTGERARDATSSLTSAAATNTVGTVSALSGTTLTLTLPNGTTKTFTVDANAAAQLRAQTGRRVDVQTDAKGNVVAVIPADQRVNGTVSAVTKDAVTLALANGKTVTFPLAGNATARLRLTPGMQVTLSTHDGGQTSTIAPAALSRINKSVKSVRGVTATVVRVAKDLVTVKMPNGRTQSIAVAARAASGMNLTPGAHVVIVTNEDGKASIVSSSQH